MAVLVNKQSGLAEDLAPDLAQQAVESGSHDLPMVDAKGVLGAAPYAEAQSLLAKGYRQPDNTELSKLLEHAKFNSTGQQLKTAAEGAASAATFGISSGVEAGLLGNAEDQLKRKEYNPNVHMAGQAAGLLGTMAIPGFGAAGLMERAGAAGAAKLGLGAEQAMATAAAGAKAAGLGSAEALAASKAAAAAFSPASRIGSATTKSAIENMVFQTGDEVSKAFLSDPHQSMETAAADIGLAGLIGAGFGASSKGIGELWKLGPGAKTEALLSAMQKRAEGVPLELQKAAGIEITPSIEAALTNNPNAKKMFSTLLNSDTKAGNQVQESFRNLRTDMDGAVASAMGKTVEDVAELSNLSKAEIGTELGTKLGQTLDSYIKPINEAYSAISGKYQQIEVEDTLRGAISTELGNYATANNLKGLSSTNAIKLTEFVQKQMAEQQNAEHLRIFAADLRASNPFLTKPETWKVAKDIASIIDEARESLLEQAAGKAGGQAAVAELRAAKDSYKALIGTLDALDERLHVGGWNGPESFQKALAAMGPEKIAEKLKIGKDTGLQQLLEKQFPEIADAVKAYERNKLAKASLDSTGTRIDTNKLLKNLDKLEPEARDYILPPEARMQLNALSEISNQIPDIREYGNASRSAPMLDKLWKHVPASAVGMMSLLMGNNPATAFIMGQMTHWLGKEAPDAIKLAMLKFMGSGAPVNAAGFQAAVKQAAAVLRGESRLNKAVKSMFETGAKVIYEPSNKDREKLKKQVDLFSATPERMLEDMNADAGHYMPEHASALGETAARNIQYLASIKPSTAPLGPLDPPRKPTSTEEAEYNRAIDIAQQPLIVLDSVKKGQLTLSDVQHLQMLYPALYSKMQTKVMDKLIDTKAKGETIPYRAKLGMATFLGQPLDASMSKQSILASFKSPLSSGMTTPKATPARADKLSKLPSSYATPEQARERTKQQ